MTRTADQTLLARMGFSDPDKANPEHDLACRFLCEPEVAVKVLGLVDPGFPARSRGDFVGLEEQQRQPPSFVAGTVEAPIIKGEGQFMQYVGFVDAALTGRAIYEERAVNRTLRHPEERLELPQFANQDERSAWFRANYRDPDKPHLGLRPAKEAWTEALPPGPWEERLEQVVVGVEVKVVASPLVEIVRQVKLYRSYAAFVRWPGEVRREAVGRDGVYLAARVAPWVLATCYDLSKADADLLRHEGIVHVRLGKGFEAFAERVRASEKSDSPEF